MNPPHRLTTVAMRTRVWQQEIRVPEVSDGVTAGYVISLTVKVGDKVLADQTLLELETDKAVVAIPVVGGRRHHRDPRQRGRRS